MKKWKTLWLKRIAAILTATMLAGMLTACGSSEDSSAAGSGTAESGGNDSGVDLSSVELVVGDQANTLKYLLEIAGLDEGTEYKLTWAEFEGAAPLYEAMNAGKTDTGYSADTPLAAAIVGGCDALAVETIKSDNAGTKIIVRDDSDVQTAADLKGKTVYVSSAMGSISEYLLMKALEDVGLTYKDVEVKYILPTDGLTAFASGDIEIWAIFGNYAIKGLGQGGRELVNGEQYLSGNGFISATSAALADEGKRAALEDFIQRIKDAYDYRNENRDAWIEAYVDLTGMDEGDAATSYDSTGETVEVYIPTQEDIDSFQDVSSSFFEYGLFTNDFEAKDFFDPSLTLK